MRRAVAKMITNRPSKALGGGGGTVDSGSRYRLDVGSVEEFYMLLDNPHQLWRPGDEVSGQIIFILKRNVVNIVITLSLIGYVKLSSASHSKIRPVKHTLFDHTIVIYGENQELFGDVAGQGEHFSNGLYKGEHRFPFIVKLPNKRVYTSIDFGRGSIKYILKASIGNLSSLQASAAQSNWNSSVASSEPRSIVPRTKNFKMNGAILSSEKLITLIAPLDVSTLPPPKPKKLIIKDPRIPRRISRSHSSASTINTSSSGNSDPNAIELPTLATIQSGNESSNNVNSPNSGSYSGSSPNVVHGEPIRPSNIKISLEIPERGYLRGESIPIKLRVNHLRQIQDLNGIIVTLVRVCRIDSGPDTVFESFRKDLQQLVLPLYVDPVTFRSEINTSMRVPADAFPTISGCPLVSFEYFIEVLINLSGKSVVLESDEKPLKIPDDSNHPLMENSKNEFKFNYHFPSSINQNVRSSFINTDKYKRMKKFLQLTTEVIIGTKRLKKAETRAPVEESPEANSPTDTVSPPGVSYSVSGSSDSGNNTYINTDSPPSQYTHRQLPNITSEHTITSDIVTPPYFESEAGSTPGLEDAPVPNYEEVTNGTQANSNIGVLMELPTQNHLSEKERIRAQEASLLPSEPPLQADTSSPQVHEQQPQISTTPRDTTSFEAEQAHKGDESGSTSTEGGQGTGDSPVSYNFFSSN